jgi:hypothetical protein
MDEAGSKRAVTRKRTIVLWPFAVLFVLRLGIWIFLYNDDIHTLLLIIGILLSVACLVRALVLTVHRAPMRSLSFLVPVFLHVATVPVPIPIIMEMTHPVRSALVNGRHRVEFLIYESQHHIKAEVRQNGFKYGDCGYSGCGYKSWPLHKDSGTYYSIVYDFTDAIGRRDGAEGGGGCIDWVNKVDEHFYILGVDCPGFFNGIPE